MRRISAAGDAYRYTLQPVYNDIRHSFRCHVRRRVPDDLYQLWFYVSVPGHFETPRIYTTVRPPTTTGRGRLDSGRFAYDEFLNVEFDTKLRLDDELIIVGRQNSTSGDRWSYGLSEVAAPDVTTSEAMVHELSDGVYVTSVEFDEPFAYSTSTWVRGNDYIYFGQRLIVHFGRAHFRLHCPELHT